MPGQINVEKDGPLGFVSFDHPERRNAITLDMWRQIPSAVKALADDDEIRVLVLRGAGEVAFVSGADISQFEQTRSAETARSYELDTLAAFDALTKCDKPVIASIHGYCIGGGVALALTADLRYAAEDATFAIPAARLGLGYHVSGLEALASVVGPSAAKEIFFTARRFSASEALSRRLVDGVEPKGSLDAAVRQTATLIAENAPLTLRTAKRTLRELAKAPSDRDLSGVEAQIKECYASADYAEGVRAFLEKRRPHFSGR
jgi:enoyl-CoA hydratase